MGSIIRFPGASDNDAARLIRLIENGELDASADAMGSTDEWAWTAVTYLKGRLEGTLGGTAGGSVNVSAAAVGLAIGFVERLASELGIIRREPSGG